MVGAWGEALAAEYLRNKGYRICHSGFQCRFGEIDLIAEDGKFLAIVEVKLRKTGDFVQAREYVDQRKQDKIRITASYYLSRHPTRFQPRFDVIEIYAPEGTQTRYPKINHIEDAFL